TGEQALEIADMLIRSGALDIVVVDSVAALVPKAEIEGEMGDSHVGLQARLMSQALRKLTGALSASGTTAIFINQLREKIGVFFGSPETTTGGKALKFYSSVRIDVRRIETLKDGADAVGIRTRARVVKNKMAPPVKQAEFDIVYGEGISREGGLMDMGVEHGIVRKSGSWYTYEVDQLDQGKESLRIFLKDNPDLANEIEEKLKTTLDIGVRAEEEAAPVPVDFSWRGQTPPTRSRTRPCRRILPTRRHGRRRSPTYENSFPSTQPASREPARCSTPRRHRRRRRNRELRRRGERRNARPRSRDPTRSGWSGAGRSRFAS